MTTRPAEIHPDVLAQFKKHGIADADQRAVLAASLLSNSRLIGLMKAMEAARGLAGDTAEIGIAAGGTSRLIALANGGRKHWACDTFEGLKDCGEFDTQPRITNGKFHNALKDVAPVLAGLDNIKTVAGYFPQSAPYAMRRARFSMVHIDVDTYQSIKNCFNFFITRMAPGGLIALDDVLERGCAGAIKAWSELENENAGRWTVFSRTEPQIVVRVA